MNTLLLLMEIRDRAQAGELLALIPETEHEFQEIMRLCDRAIQIEESRKQ